MNRVKGFLQYPFRYAAGMAMLLSLFLGLSLAHTAPAAHAAGTGGCQLNSAKGNIQHVIYIQFDNTHFTRDNSNVPSDLEQMPNLLNFMESNGVLLTNHHTPLISHTANDILTSFTGLYGDRHGVPIANSYRYFTPTNSSSVGVSFAYWTDPIFDPTTSTPTDTKFNMITSAPNVNTPAPWVPYTRAGCNFGGVATANVVLENIATDIPTVFGAGSPQAQEVTSNPGQAFADFVGIGIHCAQGNSVCSTTNTGVADTLPGEPGGYNNFNALFGNKYVQPVISPSGPMRDLNGNIIEDTAIPPHIGFPGFDGMSASVSLSYVAAMQEHGVPITYAYISDAHDNHPSGPAFGPGQAGYVSALASYNDAFGKFFTRLANDGINSSNTLFVFTSDEGDHFVGGAPSPTGCDGVTVACTYSQIGELNASLSALLGTETGNITPFKVHSDSAPTIYITGNPARNASVTRTFDQDLGQLTAFNPITNKTGTLTQGLADSVEMKLLHMVTADPARTPTLTLFADPNYFLFAGGTACPTPTNPASCVTENPAFAWNHGDFQSDIVTTWLGMVGPGVDQTGIDSTTWSDHTDIRPTIMTLVGLKDDYSHDGRVLVEDLSGYAQPAAVKKSSSFVALAQIYKQLDACVGQFGLTTLKVSTRALESSSSGDMTYSTLENDLISFGGQRDSLASQMIGLLENAEFHGIPISDTLAQSLITQGQTLLNNVNSI